jgi:septal ring factor EnvC (AmiA/AmiB activator)
MPGSNITGGVSTGRRLPYAAHSSRARVAPVDIRIDVYHHLADDGTVVALLTALGAKMSALSDTVDAILASETAEDEEHAQEIAAKDAVIAELQAQIAANAQALTDALANDAADAQTIADKQAELDAQAADVQAQIDRLNAAFPPAP